MPNKSNFSSVGTQVCTYLLNEKIHAQKELKVIKKNLKNLLNSLMTIITFFYVTGTNVIKQTMEEYAHCTLFTTYD